MCLFGFVAADDADAIALAGYAGGAVGGMVPVHMEVTEGHGCKTQKGYSYMEAVEPKWLMHLIQHDVCCINMNTIGNNVATWKGCLKELVIELATEEERAAKRRKVF